jgi:hypothetical protein
VKRTQLYLEDDLWAALHARAKRENTTISELARQALREHYMARLEDRKKAMLDFVGIRKDRDDIGDSTEYIRELRRSTRLERLR